MQNKIRACIKFLRSLSKLKLYFLASLVYLVSYGSYDIAIDLREKHGHGHTIAEAVFMLIWAVHILLVFRLLSRQKSTISFLHSQQSEMKGKLTDWQVKTRFLRENLRSSIAEQFAEWRLTRAEGEVGFLIIRGFDFVQIASLLKKSERTVRQQAISIYGKTGFRSRAEFTAFFLEAIFTPEDEDSFSD